MFSPLMVLFQSMGGLIVGSVEPLEIFRNLSGRWGKNNFQIIHKATDYFPSQFQINSLCITKACLLEDRRWLRRVLIWFLTIVRAVIDKSWAFYSGLAVPRSGRETCGLQFKGRLHVLLCLFISFLLLCIFSEQRGHNDRLKWTKMMIWEQGSEKLTQRSQHTERGGLQNDSVGGIWTRFNIWW